MTARAPRAVVTAMFLTTTVTLALQVCASRILSVTLNYHFAFLIVALAMLGMAASAITVFVESKREGGKELGATRALVVGAAVLTVGTFAFTFAGFLVVVALAQLALASSFYFCGYVVAWVLARWAEDVARLYLFDLLGAATGCIVSVVLLDRVSPLTLMLLCACALAIASALLARPTGRGVRLPAAVAGGLVAVSVTALFAPGLTRLRYAKLKDQSDVVWERWNSLARVAVRRRADDGHGSNFRLASWGLSPEFHPRAAMPELLWIDLDANAGTPIIPRTDFDFLRWDVTSTAYWLAPHHASVFIVGGGGGRDVLTATVFGARRVDVVEINPGVVLASRDVFRDQGSGVYDRPEVHLAIGNARRELANRKDRYDVIEMSMIDTWAASMSGQLTLTENTLYTREAFDLFYTHLADGGMLTISRWYHSAEYAEVARVLSLMGDTLSRHGAAAPEDHIAVVYTLPTGQPGPVASCIMKRTPFSAAERDELASVVRRMGFTVLWPSIEGLTAHETIDPASAIHRAPAYLESSDFDLTPPTDERPFFFNLHKTADSFRRILLHGEFKRLTSSSVFLWAILATLLALGSRLLLWPLRGVSGMGLRAVVTENGGSAAYFAGIGTGFMLVELALIQRFIVFLGHPTYGLSVVLFSVLLFAALGSATTSRCGRDLVRDAQVRLVVVIVLILASAFLLPPLLGRFEGASQPVRMLMAVVLIAPLALCLGMIFPTGIRILDARGLKDLVPWMWGINGFAAVLASVLGMIVAMAWGYTFVLLLGAASYAVTLASTRWGKVLPAR